MTFSKGKPRFELMANDGDPKACATAEIIDRRGQLHNAGVIFASIRPGHLPEPVNLAAQEWTCRAARSERVKRRLTNRSIPHASRSLESVGKDSCRTSNTRSSPLVVA